MGIRLIPDGDCTILNLPIGDSVKSLPRGFFDLEPPNLQPLGVGRGFCLITSPMLQLTYEHAALPIPFLLLICFQGYNLGDCICLILPFLSFSAPWNEMH